MARESDAAAAGSEALRKLHELLEHERSAGQLNSASASHLLNIRVIVSEIDRIRQLSGVKTAPRPAAFRPNPQQQQPARQSPPHNPDRSNQRCTTGRRGDR